MRILIVIATLQPGGAERVACNLANYWARAKHSISILTLQDEDEASFYLLDDSINRVNLNLMNESGSLFRAITNNLRRVFKLRQNIKSLAPDVVLSYMLDTSVLTLLATRGLNIPVVISEHADPGTYPVSGIWSLMRKLSYPLANRVVVLNRTAKAWFGKNLTKNLDLIPNPVIIPDKDNKESRLVGQLIAVGRLDYLKGFDLLIDAFAEVLKTSPQLKLSIYGDGPERGQLQKKIVELGVSTQITLEGYTTDVDSALMRAELFVMSSRTEAFPMALCEAMALGLSVISSNASAGVEELIIDGENGLLCKVGSVASLVEKIKLAIGNPELRDYCGNNARLSVQKYSIEQVSNRWQVLFSELVA
ncbi:MAG: GalNAc-alpha-(1-_4)-GalNAc-alpha-(1-_3)-diNAcBac-PP-undecaprenol alpha-1,4-N-acetyl-D-galactosaminyltransferase [Parasphingorhabdus sp.]|jgi:GalNAc-alpha-(1->4)-GalNAc-alpha-(1->3)-diNAcBac-PP-undecaprenol alpha-1,4-N-acetyl-D-galactosaminyltransferase